ncbi:fumarylacetoacetate hydrolase family protein [Zwartia sp.]|uniref:fumarylacetoacetate hydrolase family protein n=1 Tax=Zwartia sp. TaxID=2978004 RepID=UPI003BAE850D
MKLVSYTHEGKSSYGVLRADGGIVDLASRIGQAYPTLLQLVQKNGYAEAQQVLTGVTQADLQESAIRYLPLFLEPVTIHCVGLNYAAHAAEAGHKLPEFPRTFIKIPAALVAHNEDFEKPTLSPEFDFEGEIAVVISKTARKVRAEDAAQYIAGYTCFMDGSVRDYQFQRTLDQGKNFYRSSSIGPALVTLDEVGELDHLTLTTIVSGETMQHTAFDNMIFTIPKLIEYISGFTELHAGDVIATGTPEGVGFSRTPPRFLQKGDYVEVIIDKIGTLRNQVS